MKERHVKTESELSMLDVGNSHNLRPLCLITDSYKQETNFLFFLFLTIYLFLMASLQSPAPQKANSLATTQCFSTNCQQVILPER